jgi:hypothetical protein
MISVAPAAAHVPVSFKGSSRAQLRDRQWMFKHAREQVASPDATESDLKMIRDRLPMSKRGQVLRNRIDKRLGKMSAFQPDWK